MLVFFSSRINGHDYLSGTFCYIGNDNLADCFMEVHFQASCPQLEYGSIETGFAPIFTWAKRAEETARNAEIRQNPKFVDCFIVTSLV